MLGPGPTFSPDRTGFPPFVSPLNEERGEKEFLGIPRGRKLEKTLTKLQSLVELGGEVLYIKGDP